MIITTSPKKISPALFLKKRCLRILPMYWLVSLFLFLYYNFYSIKIISKEAYWKTITLLPIFDEHYFAFPILSVGWTLSFEFLFYLSVAITLTIKKTNSSFILSVLLMLLVLMGFLFPTIKNVQFLFTTNSILIEFLLGCLCGWFYLSNIKIKPLVVYAILILGVFVSILNIIFGYGYGNDTEIENIVNGTSSLKRVIYWGLGSFYITLGMLMLEKQNRLKIHHLFIILGNASYSVYLIHLPVLGFILGCYKNARFNNPDLFILVGIIVCVIAAHVIHIVIEKPLMRACNFLLKK